MAHFKKITSEQLALCVAHLSESLQDMLSEFVTQQDFFAFFTPAQVAQLLTHYSQSLTDNQRQLCRDLIPLAQSYSIAPISSFYVGAVALGTSGHIYLGANMEFKGLTLAQTVHAEQSVITNAWRNNETQLMMLAVSAPPCGHCRQFINELDGAANIDVLITNKSATNFSSLLPMSFGPSDLGINDRLMASPANRLSPVDDTPLIKHAFEAAQTSYSPFSQSPSGLSLQTSRGIYTGRYAENCAYNPSLSPLQGALISLHLSGDNIEDISHAVLVECQNSDVSQQQTSSNLLALISDIQLLTVHCDMLG